MGFGFALFSRKAIKIFVHLKWKLWLVSQGLLVLTVVIIQAVFHRAIEVGPILGTPKRSYSQIILNAPVEIPEKFLANKADPKIWDARLPMTKEESVRRNLSRYRLAYRQEEGLRTAFYGGIVVNLLYFLGFHIGYAYFRRQVIVRSTD
tara:strand:- start:241 stop:687 length:447 start_codon:yes stop_codon:yes gene_type:complete